MSFSIREHPLNLQQFGILQVLQWRETVTKAHDGLDCNFTHMKGIKMFNEHFVSSVFFDEFQDKLSIIAKIKSEMTKRKSYDVSLEIMLSSNHVSYGSCTCRAGSNPSSCKHVFSLLALLEDYSTKEMYKAPTEKLQSWHQPCPLKLPPKTATEMFSKKFKENINASRPVNMEALLKLPKSKQIFSAVDCTRLFIENTVPLPAVVFAGTKWEFLPKDLEVYQIHFLNEHILGALDTFMEIETATLSQAECHLWHSERRFRITASTFHKIISRQSKFDELCVEIKKKQNESLLFMPAVKHGIDMESIIRNKIQAKYNDCIKRKCGLVINPRFPYLGASPDGLMMRNEEPVLIEIKTIYNPRKLSLDELYLTRKDFCLKKINGQFCLKTNHKHYYQVQGQLAISNLCCCLYILHFSDDENMFVEEIPFNSDVWNTMLTQLKTFYFQKYLPYLCTIF